MPLLDGAIGSLSARDRDAVVMRFFDKQDFRSLAATLELNEDAAQKRVSRALEQLPSLVGFPALHHAQAQLVQHRRVRGRELRQAREKLIGFAAAAGGCRSLGRLDHPHAHHSGFTQDLS